MKTPGTLSAFNLKWLSRGLKIPSYGLSAKIVAFLILSVVGASFLYSHSSAASGGKKAVNPAPASVKDNGQILPTIGYRSFLPAPPAPEQIATYESDCATPKTTFQVGDTVCAKATDVPVSGLASRSLTWGAPDGTVVRQSNVTGSSKTDSFTINATSVVQGRTIDNRGLWQLAVINPFTREPEVVGTFTVSDAQNPLADVAVAVVGAPPSAQAGGQVVFSIQVNNYGPDSADNVVLTNAVPANTTFVSFAQLTGPVFTCSNPSAGGTGTSTCTLASMASGDVATFVGTYQVDSVGIGTDISDAASVAADTPDTNTENNSDSKSTQTTATPCVLTCPSNITQSADTGQAGAIVTFTTPASTGDCGQTAGEGGTPATVSCSAESGSFFPVGTTTVICAAKTGDACTFQVTIDNPGGLSISLNGASSMSIECGQRFTDPGATAVNASGQSVPVTAALPGGFNPDAPVAGNYTITYTATEDPNSVSTERTITVVDTEAPLVTVEGANPYRIVTGSCQSFVDPGVSATDSCAGAEPVTSSIVGPGGLTHVDNTVPGTYTVTYTATDGTHQATKTRTVVVGNFSEDESDQPDTGNLPPTITLNGDAQVTIECGTPFTDPGATAAVCGGSVPVTSTGTVNNHAPGNYTITYSATANGQTTTATRTVTVEADNSAPTIEVLGANPMTVECHTSFTDPGATAHDACAGDFAATASGSVNPDVVGTYVITYNATDPSGFAATPVTRTVNVVDTTNPVVTAPASLTVYTGSGSTSCAAVVSDAALGTASATDSCQGSLAATRSGVPAGNSFPVGLTTITYSATDASGNTGTATQTVTVIDNTIPVITTNGQTLSMWPPNHKYQTFQVTNFVTGASDNCTTLGVGDVVIEKVTSDEIENGNGDGNTINDIVIAADCRSVQLRAEREGNGNGRVYTITFKVTDASGNVGRATAQVVVAHNPGETPVNSGVHYTVNGTCP